MSVPYELHLSSAEEAMSFDNVHQVARKAARAVPGMPAKHGLFLWVHCKSADHSHNCMVLHVECTPAHVKSFMEKLAEDNLTCTPVPGWEPSSGDGSSKAPSSSESSEEMEEGEEEEEEPPHKRRRLDTQRWMDDIGRITVAELVAQPAQVRNRVIDLALVIAASKKD